MDENSIPIPESYIDYESILESINSENDFISTSSYNYEESDLEIMGNQPILHFDNISVYRSESKRDNDELDPDNILNFGVFILKTPDDLSYIDIVKNDNDEYVIIDLKEKKEYQFEDNVDNKIKEKIIECIEKQYTIHPVIDTPIETVFTKRNGEIFKTEEGLEHICVLKINEEVCKKYELDKEELKGLIIEPPPLSSNDYYKYVNAERVGAIVARSVEYTEDEINAVAKGESDPQLVQKSAIERTIKDFTKNDIYESKVMIAENNFNAGMIQVAIEKGQKSGLLDRENDGITIANKYKTLDVGLKEYGKAALLLQRMEGLQTTTDIVKDYVAAKAYIAKEEGNTEELQNLKKEYQEIDSLSKEYEKEVNSFIPSLSIKNDSFDKVLEIGKELKDTISDRVNEIANIHNANKEFDSIEVKESFKSIFKEDIDEIVSDVKAGIIENTKLILADEIKDIQINDDEKIKDIDFVKADEDTKDDIDRTLRNAIVDKFYNDYKEGRLDKEIGKSVNDKVYKKRQVEVLGGVFNTKENQTVITPTNIDKRNIDSSVASLSAITKFGSALYKFNNVTEDVVDRILGVGKNEHIGNVRIDIIDSINKVVKDTTGKEMDTDKLETLKSTYLNATNDENEEKDKIDIEKDKIIGGKGGIETEDNKEKVDYLDRDNYPNEKVEKEEETVKEETKEKKEEKEEDKTSKDSKELKGVEKIRYSYGAGLFAAIVTNPLIGLPIAIAGIAISEKIIKNKKDKADKTENNKVEKNESSERVEKTPFHVKFKDFSEVVKNVREDNYKDTLEKQTFNGIDTGHLRQYLTVDTFNSVDKKTNDYSQAWGNISSKLGDIYDRFHPNHITTKESDFYVKTNEIRVTDALKDSIGVKGESVSSAFAKISAVVNAWTTGISKIETNDVTNGAVKNITVQNANSKISFTDVVKSSIGLIKDITLSANRVERSDTFKDVKANLSNYEIGKDDRRDFVKNIVENIRDGNVVTAQDIYDKTSSFVADNNDTINDTINDIKNDDLIKENIEEDKNTNIEESNIENITPNNTETEAPIEPEISDEHLESLINGYMDYDNEDDIDIYPIDSEPNEDKIKNEERKRDDIAAGAMGIEDVTVNNEEQKKDNNVTSKTEIDVNNSVDINDIDKDDFINNDTATVDENIVSEKEDKSKTEDREVDITKDVESENGNTTNENKDNIDNTLEKSDTKDSDEIFSTNEGVVGKGNEDVSKTDSIDIDSYSSIEGAFISEQNENDGDTEKSFEKVLDVIIAEVSEKDIESEPAISVICDAIDILCSVAAKDENVFNDVDLKNELKNEAIDSYLDKNHIEIEPKKVEELKENLNTNDVETEKEEINDGFDLSSISSIFDSIFDWIDNGLDKTLSDAFEMVDNIMDKMDNGEIDHYIPEEMSDVTRDFDLDINNTLYSMYSDVDNSRYDNIDMDAYNIDNQDFGLQDFNLQDINNQNDTLPDFNQDFYQPDLNQDFNNPDLSQTFNNQDFSQQNMNQDFYNQGLENQNFNNQDFNNINQDFNQDFSQDNSNLVVERESIDRDSE